jgi:ribosomal-protein-alanine N-acetyltransferase
VQILETDRLVLRELQAADAPFVLELVNDPDWLRNIGDRGVRNLDDARGYILRGPQAMYARHGFGLYLAESKSQHQPVGICGLVKRDWLEDVDLGFALLPQFRGQGHAHEAAAGVLAHARTMLGMTRIAAIVAPGNHHSIRVLTKLGMRLERMVTPPGEARELCLMALALAPAEGART